MGKYRQILAIAALTLLAVTQSFGGTACTGCYAGTISVSTKNPCDWTSNSTSCNSSYFTEISGGTPYFCEWDSNQSQCTMDANEACVAQQSTPCN